jgi:hypothetical protein
MVQRGDPQRGSFPQRRQLIVVDVVQLAFGETEQKNRPQFRPESDQHPVAAAFALPFPRDPLLDQPPPRSASTSPGSSQRRGPFWRGPYRL